jgi:hypothetical protein
MPHVQRRFPLCVQRVQRHQTRHRTGVHPHRRYRPVRHEAAITKPGWRPKPSIDRAEYPTAVVIRQPAPWHRA